MNCAAFNSCRFGGSATVCEKFGCTAEQGTKSREAVESSTKKKKKKRERVRVYKEEKSVEHAHTKKNPRFSSLKKKKRGAWGDG